jgi:hypothetical protein
MTDREINERVAELAGWRHGPCDCGFDYCPKNERWQDLKGQWHDELPDFVNDLNAMHGAEESLVEVQKRRYGNILLDIVKPDEYYGEYDLLHATAKQRAAAFVKMA